MLSRVLVIPVVLLLLLFQSAEATPRRQRSQLAADTLRMWGELGMPRDSPWLVLFESLKPYVLLEPWENALDPVQQQLALTQLLLWMETRPMAGAGQDMCTSVAKAAGNTMRVRAMDAGQTLARAAAIRARVSLITTFCRRTLPAPGAPLTGAEDQAWRDARDVIYRLGAGRTATTTQDV